MTFGEVATGDAGGAVLAHSVAVGAVRWSKGRVLGSDDVAAALAAGVATLTVARLAAADVAEDDAATALAERLTGAGVTPAPAAHGRVNLIAAAAGLFHLDPGVIDAVNAVDERLTVGTLAPLARVAAGEVVATVKIIPYAVPAMVLAVAVAVAEVPLTVAPFTPRRVVLIQSRLAGTADKMLARTDAVTRDRITRLGSRLDPGGVECAHDTAALAAALAAAPDDAIVLVAGASATADRRDVIPAAIVAAGGTVARLGMPVDPGNLLVLGTLGGRPVIGLPGCARSPKRNGFDWVLERLAAGLTVGDSDIAGMGVGGLLPEAERPQPRVAASVELGADGKVDATGGLGALGEFGGLGAGAAVGTVGAVVLAAGRSTRMGGANKLLADLDGLPVIARTLDALRLAGLPPPVVVLGHMADDVRAAIGARSATCVVSADYAAGMSRSLAAGLAAAPPGWRAALIVLGDMPRVAPATLAAIAASAVDAHAVVVPVFDGARGNPVAWGRAHWPRLAALTGDVGGRGLLGEVDVIEVAAEDAGILADIDTPEALAALRAMVL